MTVVTDATPDHWEGEDVIITIEEEGLDTVLNMEGTVLKTSKSGGESGSEEAHAFGGKTFAYGKPKSKITLTFDVVIKNTDWDRIHSGGSSAMTLGATTEVRSSATERRKRITFWYCPKANQLRDPTTTTIIVPTSAGAIYRKMYCDCRSVTFDWDFDSGEYKKGTLTFELSALDSDGYANVFSQFTTGQSTTPLVSLSSGGTTTILTIHKGALFWSATATRSWSGSYRT